MAESKIMTSTSSFEIMREDGSLYVDKTALVYRMVSSADKSFFLSRPRRFGKSLLVSTLQAYFEGRKELFDGLAIADLEKDWVKYPVFKFDMSNMKDASLERLDESLDIMLKVYEAIYGCDSSAKLPSTRLQELIRRARGKTGLRAVVLPEDNMIHRCSILSWMKPRSVRYAINSGIFMVSSNRARTTSALCLLRGLPSSASSVFSVP